MSASVVQTKSNANTNVDTDITVVLDSTPHDGNTLVAFYCVRGDHDPVTPSGWTLAETFDGPDFDGGRAVIFHRAVSSTPATVTIQKGASAYAALFVAEVAGVSGIDASDSANSVGASTALSAGPLTAATGVGIIVFAAFNQSARAAEPFTWGTGWTAIDSEQVNASGPAFAAGYRILPLATGTQTATATSSESDGYGWGMISFLTGAVPASTYIDWDEDGFNSFDELPIQSWRIQQGSAAQITGGATPGSATIVVINPSDDRFNPLNTSGPLYGKLRDGVPVWIGVNSDGVATGTDPRGLFAGRVKSISPLPTSGLSRAPFVEFTCEDPLAWMGRTPVRVADALFRSQAEFRTAVLSAAGETRTELAHEILTMPISSWDGDALDALETLNRSNGTRHFIRALDNADSWYDYTTRNRQWRLDATVDASLDAGTDHVTGTGGWTLTADTVINQQKVSVIPVNFSPGNVTVWQAQDLPFVVTSTTTRVLWLEFDDFVSGPVVDINYTGTAPTTTLDAFGDTARLTIASAGTTTVKSLSVEGSILRRGAGEAVVEDDTTSQAGPRGVRAGSDISGALVGVRAMAQGLAAHIVWRYGDPQYRPTLTVENWFPEMFEIQLYDVLSVTIDSLGMTARLFEVVGRTLEARVASDAVQHHIATYVLQECKVQADPGWFILDTSLLDDTDQLAY